MSVYSCVLKKGNAKQTGDLGVLPCPASDSKAFCLPSNYAHAFNSVHASLDRVLGTINCMPAISSMQAWMKYSGTSTSDQTDSECVHAWNLTLFSLPLLVFSNAICSRCFLVSVTRFLITRSHSFVHFPFNMSWRHVINV